MPKRTNKFQQLVVALEACHSESLVVSESKLLIDTYTGAKREVDIFIESTCGLHDVKISIEVSAKSRPADVIWVEQLVSKHSNLPTNKLALISESGYTKEALLKAAAQNVEVLTLEEATDTDWPTVFLAEEEGYFQLFNINYECSAHVSNNSKLVKAPLDSLVDTPEREVPTDVGIIARHILDMPETISILSEQVTTSSNREFNIRYPFPKKSTINIKGRLFGLIEIVINISVEFKSTPIKYFSKSLKGNSMAIGQATGEDSSLCFAVKKDSNGAIKGVLYDSGALRSLNVNTIK